MCPARRIRPGTPPDTVVTVRCTLSRTPVTASILRGAAEKTLQRAGKRGDITLLLAGDDLVRSLNRRYLRRDRTTDVLSFPSGERAIGRGSAYLGDIAISVPRARVQANRAGHSLSAELQLLVVHGVLHLLGHDHRTAVQKRRMWGLQAAVLANLGLGHVKATES